MKKINKKLTLIILSGFILVTGCNKTETKPLVTNKTSINTVSSVQNEEMKIKTNDEKILDYVDDLKQDVDDMIKSKEVKDAKETIIKKFIILTDFIFYDTEINGIKFNDLKEETKESILDAYTMIDNQINDKFPNYKEKLQDKYNLAKTKIKDKYKEISNDIKETIGEDTYNNIKETNKDIIEQDKKNLESIKDKVVEKIGEENYNNLKETNKEIIEQDKKNLENIKEKTIETTDKAKIKVKEWYQNLKENH